MKTPRLVTPEEAAALVRSGDWVVYGTCLSQPDVVDAALAARAGDLRGVKVRSCIFRPPPRRGRGRPRRPRLHRVQLAFRGPRPRGA